MREWIKNNKKIISTMGIGILYVALLAPYVYSTLHAIPTSDDFCMILNGEPHLSGCLSYAATKYMNWSGEFIFFFLQYFMNPLAFAGVGSFLYGILMCTFFLLFVFSFRYFIKSWLKCLFDMEGSIKTEVLSVFLIAIFLFANNYHEVIYWYVGSFYEVEYALAFIAIGSMLRYFNTENGDRRYYAILIILGVITCNAVNMCVIVGMSYLAIASWYLCKENRKINFKIVFPFAMYVCMGCATVFAPGNFARKPSGGNDAIIKAIIKAFTCNVRRIFYLSENNTVFYMFIVLFFLGFIGIFKYNAKIKNVWILLVVMAICLYGTLLPVAVGYGDTRILNNRVCYLIDAITIPMLEIYIFGLGIHMSERIKPTFSGKEKIYLKTVLICLFYAIVIKDNGYGSCEYINQISNISSVKQERNLWVNIYNDIYNTQDTDVVITVPDEIVVKSGVLENPMLDEDPEFWVNSEIRRYFNKNSISVVLNEME